MSITRTMRTKRKSALKVFRKKWQLHLFMLIPVAYIIIFAYCPMFGIQIAFKNFSIRKGIWGSEWVGMKHFATFFTSFQFLRCLKNTLIISLYSFAVGFPIPIFFALMMNLTRNIRFRKVVQTVTYIPHFISTVVLVGMLIQLLNPVTGLYGTLYRLFGGVGYPTAPTTVGSNFPHLYVLSGVWQGFGYNSILYLAALSGVSAELHEAAEIDGASRLQRVIHIDFPAILPTVTIMLIMRMGSVMSLGFQKIYLMQNTLNLSTSEVISTFVYKKGLASGAGNDYSYSTAIGMFNSVINLLLLVCVNGVSRKLSENSLW